MSEAEGFLTRWSRRKAAEGRAPAPADEPVSTGEQSKIETAAPERRAESHDAVNPVTAAENPAPFDVSKLPPIESITAATDIRAFLAPGVPAELARAALRRAWTVDPAIRDFVGIAENQWDFSASAGIPGFGPLEAHDVRRLVAEILGEIAQGHPDTAAHVAPTTNDAASNDDLAASPLGRSHPPQVEKQGEEQGLAPEHHASVVQNSKEDAAPHEEHSERRMKPRGHGGALPQ
jgi:hypothetical protein